MDLGLAGRVAMVAGASSGLGRAAARALAREGCTVCLGARDPRGLADTAAELAALAAAPVLTYPVDVTDETAAADWVAWTAAELGAVHVLVTNTGGPPPGTVDSFRLDAYRAAVDSTLLPHIGLTLAALPHMCAAGYGRILMVASETVRQPIPHYGLSSTVRPGLLGFTRSLVHTLGPAGITVNVLAPGYHDTPGLRGQFADDEVDDRLAELGRTLPLGRVGAPDDFGAVVAFLAGTGASFITGTCLLVDGGATRGIG